MLWYSLYISIVAIASLKGHSPRLNVPPTAHDIEAWIQYSQSYLHLGTVPRGRNSVIVWSCDSLMERNLKRELVQFLKTVRHEHWQDIIGQLTASVVRVSILAFSVDNDIQHMKYELCSHKLSDFLWRLDKWGWAQLREFFWQTRQLEDHSQNINVQFWP